MPALPFADDARVLFLSSPGDAELRALAHQLAHGLIVVLGDRESVSQGRRLHADLENVMFVPATAEDIPWQNEFFDQVLDPQSLWSASERADAETARVLRKR